MAEPERVPGLDWLVRSALPLWTGAGWDRETRTFVERLDGAGRPIAGVPRRVMVQARQIFVMGVAHRRGWAPDAASLLRDAVGSMVRLFHARDGRPGWIFSIDPSGAPADPTRDLYAQAFVLLALASAFEAIRERSCLDLAAETLAFLDAEMSRPSGGFAETWPEPRRPRRQNPHMHLFEALLALHGVDPDGGYLGRAEQLLALAENRFVLGRGPALVEFFDEDWTPEGEAPYAFEPGHHFEWVWLLDRFERLGGRSTSALAGRLLRSALESGIAPSGLVLDEVREDGAPLKSSARLWPQTEAAKAMATRVAKEAGAPSSSAFLARLKQAFLDPAHPGSWIDHLSATGEPLAGLAPASSLYHLVCAYDVVSDAAETES